MSDLIPANSSQPDLPAGLPPLVEALRGLILQARQKVLSAANAAQVRTYWEIGRHIVEFEQGGAARADYGKGLLTALAKSLTKEFGKGFDATNLRHMRDFYRSFPICDALRRELSWTHYRLLLRVDAPPAREWYMQEAAAQNWSSRVLERQIASLAYERLLSSQNSAPALPAGVTPDSPAVPTARDFIRDPVMLEFLGLPDTGRLLESELENALMDKLQQFLLELGKGFAFVARQQRISTETQDFYLDLVFYNYLLKCFVLIDLKTGHLTHQDIGQMDMYVRLYDDQRRGEGDNPTVGLLLCGSKDQSVVRYSVLHESEQLFASKYRLILPSEEELRRELDRERAALDERRALGEGTANQSDSP
ncbi:PDDEXK nuclease domain-containing protein [Opitutales bacterium ASA1]|uniref:PDDEXK nuclease domain-containing protein n=1 Tax=Congregicoccus parvus TaxID=3081749 RepID=UPI002B29C244|nr:PDDEXK nuclease domain-containing protein [Opitutales bacterium ASA1]